MWNIWLLRSNILAWVHILYFYPLKFRGERPGPVTRPGKRISHWSAGNYQERVVAGGWHRWQGRRGTSDRVTSSTLTLYCVKTASSVRRSGFPHSLTSSFQTGGNDWYRIYYVFIFPDSDWNKNFINRHIVCIINVIEGGCNGTINYSTFI